MPAKPPVDPDQARRVRALLDATTGDPELFSKVILGRPLLPHQVAIAKSVFAKRRTIVAAANSVGKDYTAANIIINWLVRFPGSLVVCTAPSQQLLGSVLFKNLRAALAGSRIPIGAKISESAGASPQRIAMGDDPEWGAIGLATSPGSVAKLSGHHSPHLLVVADEASDLEPATWEALAGLKARSTLAIGNPLHPDGAFKRLFEFAESDPDSSAIRVSAWDAGHAELEHSPLGLPDATYIAAMMAEWGADSAWVDVHLRALFPGESDQGLFLAAWLDLAASTAHVPGGPRWIGIDLGLGTGGDSTVLVVRDANGVLEMISGNRLGLEAAAAEARRLQLKHGVEGPRVVYDQAGLGADFAHRLTQAGVQGARGYVGAKSGGSKKYANLRTAAYFALRARMDPGRVPGRPAFTIPADALRRMRPELLGVRYREAAGGKLALESKDLLAARLKRSPDAADALALCHAFPE